MYWLLKSRDKNNFAHFRKLIAQLGLLTDMTDMSKILLFTQ